MAQSPTGPLRRPQQHEEIADYLRDEIFAGHIPAGESLPSEVELCEQFNTSRGPVRQAVATLRAEGLLSSGRGRRSLVLSNTRTETFEEILSNTSWIYRMGKEPGEVVEEFGVSPADEKIAECMGIDSGDDVFSVRRVRTADGEPIVAEEIAFDASLAETIQGIDTSEESIHRELIRAGTDFNNISRAFTVERADEATAAKLGLEPGAPVLVIKIKAYTHNGKILSIARDVYRTESLHFGLNNVRGHSSPLWFQVESSIQ